MVDLAKQVGTLESQITDLRKANHTLENELSQEQVINMNAKLEREEWLSKDATSNQTIAQLKADVSQLKHSLEEQQLHEATLLTSLAPNMPASVPAVHLTPPPKRLGHERDSSIMSAVSLFTVGSSFRADSSPSTSSGNKDKTIDRLKNELDMVQQQTEMISREYAMRHSQMEMELKQTKTRAERLEEENKAFQAQLAERIILSVDLDDDDAPDDMSEGPSRTVRAIVERLVQRLMEFQEFSKLVNVDAESLTSFERYMSTATWRHGESLDMVGRTLDRIRVVQDPTAWVSIVFAGGRGAHGVTSPASTAFSSAMDAESASTPATSLASVMNNPPLAFKRPQLETQTKLRPLTILSQAST